MGGVLFGTYKPIKIQTLLETTKVTLTNSTWDTSNLASVHSVFGWGAFLHLTLTSAGFKRILLTKCRPKSKARKRNSQLLCFPSPFPCEKGLTIPLDDKCHSDKSTKTLQRKLGTREVVYPNVDAEVYVRQKFIQLSYLA